MNPLHNICLRVVVALLIASQSVQSIAVDDYYADRARGWFWREEPPEPIELEPEPIMPPEPQSSSAPPPESFSVEWFRKNLDSIRNRAIDNPSKENVLALLSAERVMRDKATKYATVTQQVLRDSPWIDENVRRPVSQAGENMVENIAKASIEKHAPLLAKQAAIWFFYRADCPYCKEQIMPLKYLSEKYGFRIMPIAIDGQPLPGNPFNNWRPDSGQAQKLNVTMTPTLYLVRPPGDYAALAYGLTPAEEVVTRAVDIASSQGWLPKSVGKSLMHAQEQPEASLRDAGEDIKSSLSPDNPKAINDYVKRILQGK